MWFLLAIIVVVAIDCMSNKTTKRRIKNKPLC